jgi:hypothetical protein
MIAQHYILFHRADGEVNAARKAQIGNPIIDRASSTQFDYLLMHLARAAIRAFMASRTMENAANSRPTENTIAANLGALTEMLRRGARRR